jgi:hypothetical protein
MPGAQQLSQDPNGYSLLLTDIQEKGLHHIWQA